MVLNNAEAGAEVLPGSSSPANHSWFISYLLSNVSGGLISPLMPLFIVLYLHASVVEVGTVSSVASAASVPALIFWGNLSDMVGKRKIFLLIGFVGSFLSLLLILISNTIGMYTITLVIFQAIAMASTPVATLLILESTVEKRWPNVMASFNAVSYIGLVAGLLAGTLMLSLYGNSNGKFLQELYLIAAVVYLVAGVSAWVLLPEPTKKISRDSPRLFSVYSIRTVEKIRYFPSRVIHILTLRKTGKKLAKRTKTYIFYTCFLMFGFQLFFIPFPVFLLDRLGGNETQIFIMYLLNNIASAFAFRFSGKSLNSWGVGKTLSVALFSRVGILAFLTFLAFYMMGFTYSAWIAIAGYGLMGFFWSFISVSWVTSISKLAIPENRGKAIGYYNSFLGIGQIASGFISGYLAFTLGYGIDFLTASIVVLVGGVMLLRFQSKMKDLIVAREVKATKLPWS